jgi:hypothetical protein
VVEVIERHGLFASLYVDRASHYFFTRAGHKVLSLQSITARGDPSSPALCTKAQGFSPHAGLRCSADQRTELLAPRRAKKSGRCAHA